MKTIENIVLVVLLVSATYAAEDVVGAVHGTIKKVDSSSKTIVVKVADRTDHSMHVVAEGHQGYRLVHEKCQEEGSPLFREGLEQRTLNRCSHTSHSVAIERGRDRT